MPGESHPRLDDGFERIRREMRLPEEFPGAVIDEAEWVSRVPSLPEQDRTDLPLITVDPPGSMDLDQAMHLEEQPGGYRVWYAIADVGAFVRPGGVIDAEARDRGETVYMPDGRVPLHPAVLSEGAASLLPGVTRPAALWCVDLDADGQIVGADVTRALVCSRERLDYDYVQAAVDTGTADGTLRLLAEIGRSGSPWNGRGAGSRCPCPTRRSSPTGTATTWSCASRWRPRPGTPRSRC
ncbi:RNB domain-containing ribonuclease [Streptosporangium lutulentum]